MPDQLQRGLPGEVLGLEDVAHLLGRDLAALGVGDLLYGPGELDLQAPGQVQLVLVFMM